VDPVEPAAGEAVSTDVTADTLDDLRRCLEASMAELTAASERVAELQELRAAGNPWIDIVIAEERPLVVERITHVLDELGEAGGRFRRAEALALQQEGVSLNRIGQLFGVSRQRASVLVKERPPPPDETG
jgi:hypothetical protein